MKRRQIRRTLIGLVLSQLIVWLVGRAVRRHFLNEDLGKDSVNAVAIFGGEITRLDSKNFTGGIIRVVFGGVELDLSECEISDPPIELEMKVIFGGVKITVPDAWRVDIRAISVLSGIQDARGSSLSSGDDIPDLVLTGRTTFGGVLITS